MKPLPWFIQVSVVVAKLLSARSGDYPPGSNVNVEPFHIHNFFFFLNLCFLSQHGGYKTIHLQAEKAGEVLVIFSQYTAYHPAQGRHACRKLVRIVS